MVGRSALLVVACALGGCDTLGIDGSVEVRVENGSSLDFDHVSFWAANQEVSQTALASGQSTPYVEAEGAYRFTTVEVSVDGDTVRLQVIDYVGETPLASGRYTYLIGLEGPPGSRTMTQVLRTDS